MENKVISKEYVKKNIAHKIDKIELDVYAPDKIMFTRENQSNFFYGKLEFIPARYLREEEAKEIMKMLSKTKLKLTIQEDKDEI